MPTMVVSKLFAIVGSDTAKIRLEVPARKFPNAALLKQQPINLSLGS